MPIVNTGKGSGGTALTTTEQAVLDELYVNPLTGALTSKIPLTTDVDRLYIGETWDISSGNDNIFLINRQTDARMYPMMGGLKNQCLVENQGPDGLIYPAGRVYAPAVSGVSLNPNLESSPYVYGSHSSYNLYVAQNSSLYKMILRPELQFTIGTLVTLEIRAKSINGTLLYKQILTLETFHAPGDLVEFCFDHSVDTLAGEYIHILVSTPESTGPDNTFTITSDVIGSPWCECNYREYEDKDAMFVGDSVELNIVTTANESVSGYNLTNFYGKALPNPSSVLIDNNGDVITHE